MGGTDAEETTRRRPETVRLMLLLFATAVGGEILHQILGIVMGVMDPSLLYATARESMSAEQAERITEPMLRMTVIGSIVVAGSLGIAVMGLLAVMLNLVRRQSRYAGLARRMLLVFGFYFGLRVLMVFLSTPGGADVPVALYLIDGIVQILVGVAAVTGLVFSFREDTLRWTGEIDSAGRRVDPRRK